jgi:hypothetical protein
MANTKRLVETVIHKLESTIMTQEYFYWTFGVSVAATLLAGLFLQPFFSWIGRKLFTWMLSLNAFRRQFFYMKVAQRNTSYTSIISYLATAVFGTAGVLTLHNHPYGMFLLNVVTYYGLIGYVISLISLTTVEGMIRKYDLLKASVRPYVEESFLVMLDSQYAAIKQSLSMMR